QERLRGSHSNDVGAQQLNVAAKNANVSVADVERIVNEWMVERPLKHLRRCRALGIDALLALFARAHVPVGLLSDYPAQARLRALGWERRFSPILGARDPELDAFKPHPRGFLHAASQWNVDPSDVLFVGDRMDVDAAGAAAAGMPSVIVTRSHTTASAGCMV